MKSSTLAKAGILMLVLVTATLVSWELYVRSKGFDTSFDEGPPIWSDKRAMVYEPADKAVVFIGSSRIKFDLDIDEWETITGCHAIQLACVGSNPIPVLENLADDNNFKGRLIVDVTEILFFTIPTETETPVKNIKYYKDRTPAQWASFQLDHLAESQFAFLDKDRLSLNATLDNLHIPNRDSVLTMPIFPPDFGRSKFNRQEYMTNKFLTDTAQINKVRSIWAFYGSLRKEPPLSGKKLDSMFAVIKTSVDKIRARGGEVLFVRTPSSGPFLAGEQQEYPREKYWDRLLSVTNSTGIYFADYPAIAHLQCPEFSHLSQADASFYTKNLIKILSEEKGWKFPKPIQL